jgi:hypothetical protein
MAAQRPIILEALRSRLEIAVDDVAERVCFPWDDPTDGPMIQIAMGESTVDNGESIGSWLHTIQLKIGAIVAGAYDYPAAWELLNTASAALVADYTLGGTCSRITITGAADSIETGGQKIMWPHLVAAIDYLTPKGAL